MASFLFHKGNLQKNMSAVLFIPGGMAMSPIVFSGIESEICLPSAVIEWSRSIGPWDIITLGQRLLEFIQEQKLINPIVAGYSAGGVIALAAAIADTQKIISGLLLSNTGPCAIGHGDPDLPARINQQWFSKSLYENFLTRCFSKPITEKLKSHLIEYARQVDKQVVLQSSKSLREHDLRSLLKHISCPVVIAHGILDKTRTMDHVDMLTQGIKNTECFLLQGGHTIMIEDRENWIKALNHLISKVKNNTHRR